MRICFATTVLFGFVIAAMAPRAMANDLYIGTLSVQGDQVTLERCDLSRNTYLLIDAPGSNALMTIRNQPPAAKGFWYGEVIGEYTQVEGQHALSVVRIEDVQPNKSCHLTEVNVGIPPAQSSDGEIGADGDHSSADEDEKSNPIATTTVSI